MTTRSPPPDRASPAARSVRAPRRPHAAPVRGSCAERAVEPAGLQRVRARRAVLEHVLAVEVRALAIGAGERVQHRQLARRVALLQKGERRMQTEETVERQRPARLARRMQGELAPQPGVVAVAEGGTAASPSRAPRMITSTKRDGRASARANARRVVSSRRPRRVRPVEEFASCCVTWDPARAQRRMNSGAASSSVTRLRGARRVRDRRARGVAQVRPEQLRRELQRVAAVAEPLRRRRPPIEVASSAPTRHPSRRCDPASPRASRAARCAGRGPRRARAACVPASTGSVQAAKAGDHVVARGLVFRQRLRPGLGRLDQRTVDARQIAGAARESIRQAATAAGGGSSAMK